MPLAKFEDTFPQLVAALRRARREQRLATAYLIGGDDEGLREEFAIAVAQTALCPHDRDGEACGVCVVCRQLVSGTYLDLCQLMPTSKSRKIIIGDDEHEPDTMRWFRTFFQFASAGEAGIKVGIIHDADCLTPQSQNAFLKTLEEPPGNTLFLLVTGHPLALQPTIRSRCQLLPLTCRQRRYDFPGADELVGLLHRLASVTADNLAAATQAADEMIALAARLKEAATTQANQTWGPRLAAAAEIEADPRILKHLEERHKAAAAANYRQLRQQFLSCIHAWYAQSYLLSAGVAPEMMPNPELMREADPGSLKQPESLAAARLRAAEELLGNLNWNVRDDLALTAFCLAVTR